VTRSIDSNDNIAQRIPLLITGVVLLSMLLLLVAFRSIAVAVKAAVMNLLSVAAACWWMPRRLGRTLPELHVEGRPETCLARRDRELTQAVPQVADRPVG
jgi:uncharacterized membrane protein YdfJ with MMPL/SSD domain